MTHTAVGAVFETAVVVVFGWFSFRGLLADKRFRGYGIFGFTVHFGILLLFAIAKIWRFIERDFGWIDILEGWERVFNELTGKL